MTITRSRKCAIEDFHKHKSFYIISPMKPLSFYLLYSSKTLLHLSSLYIKLYTQHHHHNTTKRIIKITSQMNKKTSKQPTTTQFSSQNNQIKPQNKATHSLKLLETNQNISFHQIKANKTCRTVRHFKSSTKRKNKS